MTPSDTPAPDRAAGWAWDRQSVWSQVANQLKARLRRSRTQALGLTLCVAVLALTASQLLPVDRTAGIVVSVAGAVVAGVLTLVQARDTSDQSQAWTRARSVSEALKSETYLFLTGTGRYAGDDRGALLDAAVQRIEHDVDDLADRTVGITPTPRLLPPVTSVPDYVQVRVLESQVVGYYEPKAIRNLQRVRVARLVRGGLTLLAGTFTALAVVATNLAAWAAVVSAAAAAVAAHAAAERYDYLSLEYSRTANELRRLVTRRTAPDGSPLPDDELAARCEDVISIENQGWMAKLAAPT